MHGEGPGQIVADHLDGPPLGPGELETQAGDEPVDQGGLPVGPGDQVADPLGVLLQPLPAQHQVQLEPEQLVEGQATAGGLAFLERRRPVDLVEGRRPVQEPVTRPEGIGQRVGKGAGPVQGLGHVPTDAGRGEPGPFGERIDGKDPTGGRHRLAAVDVALAIAGRVAAAVALAFAGPVLAAVAFALAFAGGLQDLDGRAVQLPRAPVGADGAEEQGQGADRQLLGPPHLVEEDHLDMAALVGHFQLHPGRRSPPAASVARARATDPGHPAEHGCLGSGGQGGDGDQMRPVDVAALAWVVGDQVEDRADAELGELPFGGGSDPSEDRHRQFGQLAEPAAMGAGRPGRCGRSPFGRGRVAHPTAGSTAGAAGWPARQDTRTFTR